MSKENPIITLCHHSFVQVKLLGNGRIQQLLKANKDGDAWKYNIRLNESYFGHSHLRLSPFISDHKITSFHLDEDYFCWEEDLLFLRHPIFAPKGLAFGVRIHLECPTKGHPVKRFKDYIHLFLGRDYGYNFDLFHSLRKKHYSSKRKQALLKQDWKTTKANSLCFEHNLSAAIRSMISAFATGGYLRSEEVQHTLYSSPSGFKDPLLNKYSNEVPGKTTFKRKDCESNTAWVYYTLLRDGVGTGALYVGSVSDGYFILGSEGFPILHHPGVAYAGLERLLRGEVVDGYRYDELSGNIVKCTSDG